MAKKETKKTSKKSTTKKSVIKEVAESIIKEEKMDLVEQDPPIEQEYLDTIVENMATAEPFIEKKEPEYEPTEEQIQKAIEFMNGDPSVIIPSNDIELKKVDEIEEAAFKETFKSVKIENKRNSRIDRTFGYSWNGIEIDF